MPSEKRRSVAMPFGKWTAAEKSMQRVYELAVRPATKGKGFVCRRPTRSPTPARSRGRSRYLRTKAR